MAAIIVTYGTSYLGVIERTGRDSSTHLPNGYLPSACLNQVPQVVMCVF